MENIVSSSKSCFNGTISFIRSKKQLIFKQLLSLAAKTVYPINHWLTIDCSSNKTLMWILLISQRLKVVCHLFAITGFVLNHIIMRKFRNTWMLIISVKIFNKGKQFEWFQHLQQKLIIGHSFVNRNYISVVIYVWNRLKQTNCKSKKLVQHANVIYYYNRVRIHMHGILSETSLRALKLNAIAHQFMILSKVLTIFVLWWIESITSSLQSDYCATRSVYACTRSNVIISCEWMNVSEPIAIESIQILLITFCRWHSTSILPNFNMK